MFRLRKKKPTATDLRVEWRGNRWHATARVNGFGHVPTITGPTKAAALEGLRRMLAAHYGVTLAV